VTEEEFNIPFSMGDVAELEALLTEAGFGDIEITQESREARFADSDNFIYNIEYAYSAVIPEFAADPGLFTKFVDAVTEETRDLVASYRDGGEIVFPLHANIAVARR
jgi:hypothetical protein